MTVYLSSTMKSWLKTLKTLRPCKSAMAGNSSPGAKGGRIEEKSERNPEKSITKEDEKTGTIEKGEGRDSTCDEKQKPRSPRGWSERRVDEATQVY